MYQFIKFHFVVRKIKSNPETGVLYIRLTNKNSKAEFSTRFTLPIEIWNPKLQRAKGNTKLAQTINHELENLRFQYESHKRYLLENNQELTPSSLKNSLMGNKPAGITLLYAVDDFLNRVDQLKNIDYSKATVEKYHRVKKYLVDFMVSKSIHEDFPIQDLAFSFIRDFDVFLKSQKKQSNNTCVKFMRTFKTIITSARQNEWIQHDPFVNYKGTVVTKERPKLSQVQLSTLKNKTIHNERIRKIRDAFIFGCYTGLAFTDMKELTPSDIREDLDGTQWINKPRVKTGIMFKIPLLPVPKEIIKRYKNDPECLAKGTLLPIPSNQKYNAYLKELMNICNIDFNLTSHIARHTFATTVALENGVSMETVSKILGHSNTNMTHHYGKITENRLREEMKTLSEKLDSEKM
jgi:site-specific recombinase XerD